MSKANIIGLGLLPLMLGPLSIQTFASESSGSYQLNKSVLQSASMAIDFVNNPVLSFGSQDSDKVGAVNVSVDGTTLTMADNRWQYIPVNYTITEHTVISFDVLMHSLGEIQGVAFYNDLSPTPSTTFQLAGTQNWASRTYSYKNLGSIEQVKIKVGQNFTGNFKNLVFISDNDRDSSGDIEFRNVVLSESDTAGESFYQVVKNDNWRSIASALYGNELAAQPLESILAGKYSLAEGEKIRISDLPEQLSNHLDPAWLDSDGDGLKDEWELFHFNNLQQRRNDDADLDGRSNFEEQAAGTSPVLKNMALNANAFTSDAMTVINFQTAALTPHSNQDDATTGNIEILDNGNSLRMVGNRWMTIPMNYSVTSNTILEFDFTLNAPGEVQGIGFDNDMSASSNLTFNLSGSQAWGHRDFVKPMLGEKTRFQINAGQYFQSDFSHLLLIGDDDANKKSDITFSNLRLIEQGVDAPLYYRVTATDTWETIASKLYGSESAAGILRIGLSNQYTLGENLIIPAEAFLLDIAEIGPQWMFDSDSDGMPDSWELRFGLHDFDPFDAHLDLDADGLTNLQEFKRGSRPDLVDTDLDGEPDGTDVVPNNALYKHDQDGDGLPDTWEMIYGLDVHGAYDAHHDFDADGLTNLQEFKLGSSPINPDSDNDGVPDAIDFAPINPRYKIDQDKDGMPLSWELANQPLSDDMPDDAKDDFDADGLTNLQEFLAGTNPNLADTDNDGELDGTDVAPTNALYRLDQDKDGLPDEWEIANQLSDVNSNDAHEDFDSDGLTNLEEFQQGTNPHHPDSDLDGVFDGEDFAPTNAQYRFDQDKDGLPAAWENQHGLYDQDPIDAFIDVDNDRLTNLEEFFLGTNPRDQDTDKDGVLDGDDVSPLSPRYGWDHDKDGLPQRWEVENGLSDDNPFDAFDDQDGDTLTALAEYQLGTDPRHPDTDSDNVPDNIDFAPLNARYGFDSDKDGIPQEWERLYPAMTDSSPDDAKDDFDADGLTNLQEFLAGTNPNLADTDNDGELDGTDVAPTNALYRLDQDNDGLPDAWEIANQLSDVNSNDAHEDFDSDGLTNLEEFQQGTNPHHPDSDLDGVFDGEDFAPTNAQYRFDQDKDGLPAEWENQHGLNDQDPMDAFMDVDNDRLTNLEEFVLGTNPRDQDTDKDGVLDGDDISPLSPRYGWDHDKDGLPQHWEVENGLSDDNPLDAFDDQDGDTLTALAEYQLGTDPRHPDTDSDNVPDNIDFAPLNARYGFDSDKDGMPQEWERLYPPMTDSSPHDAKDDFDADGLTNLQEFLAGTNPNLADTDNDGELDGTDVAPTNALYRLDQDNDGLPDAWEIANQLSDVNSNDAHEDFDSDGLTNLEEFQQGTNPHHPDSDLDGVFDGEDFAPTNPQYRFDQDKDGLPAEWENQHGLNDQDPMDAFIDVDNDGLTNLEEFVLGTNPINSDTDGDGVPDGFDFDSLDARYGHDNDGDGIPYEWERLYSFLDDTHPDDAHHDFDNDGLTALQEFLAGTNPQISDSDNDGELDGVDIAPTNAQYRFDQDKDGLPDEWEMQFGMQVNDPLDANNDLDNDGLNNLEEYLMGTDPREQDSDSDGVFDNEDFAPAHPRFRYDHDFDGIPEQWEIQYGLSDSDPQDALADNDGDNLTNFAEFKAGTDPHRADSDADGVSDREDAFPLDPQYRVDNDQDGLPATWEMQYGLSDHMPEDAKLDMDGDNYDNLAEFAARTNPNLFDPFIPTAPKMY
ncbi:hypothetical protein [Motilimonas cestriensis]|uniref:hypothetical protein n=1 Tax=Motilimonas cestriensis TaxID=2742685 RepID=UPI003DA5D6AE